MEKYLGIRWYWPGELGEVVPEKESIKVGRINISEASTSKKHKVSSKEKVRDKKFEIFFDKI